MAAIRKRIINNRTYYYLEQSLREGGRVLKKQKYLGKTLPYDMEAIQRQFRSEIYRKRWFDQFDLIKTGYVKHQEAVPPSIREKAIEDFITRFTCDTIRLDGHGLTLNETYRLFGKGITPNMKPLVEVKEAEAQHKAFREMLDNNKALSFEGVVHFHKRLFEHTDEDIAGIIRKHTAVIPGGKFMHPYPSEIYPELTGLFEWYGHDKDILHPVHLAGLIHLRLVTIRPFADGNGRTARLLMNYVLYRHGYPMLNIPYGKKAGYYRAVERSLVKKDEHIFLGWLFKRYLDGYGIFLE